MASDSLGTGNTDLVELRAQQDATLCVALLEEILARFGLGHGDLGGQWNDVRKALVVGACQAAASFPAYQQADQLRLYLEEQVALLHVRAVVRVSIAVICSDAVHEFCIVDGVTVINGISDEQLTTPSVNNAVDRLVAAFRKNPRKMGISDYLESVD